MDLLKANTPEKLYQVIGEFLQSDYSSEDLKRSYDDARKCAHRLRVTYPILSAVPACSDDVLEALQEIREWCVSADAVVDAILGDLRPQAIRETISLLRKVRDIADSVIHTVNGPLRERVKNEMTARSESEYNRRMKEAKERIEKKVRADSGVLSPSVVDAQARAEIMRDIGLIMPGAHSDAVQTYLSEDPTFNDRLSPLRREACRVIEKINELVDSNTTSGQSLDLYCKLKEISLGQRFEDVEYACSFADLDDVIFSNCSRFYNSVDNGIQTLEQIQTKAKQRKRLRKTGQAETVRLGYEASKLRKVPVSELIEHGEGHAIEFKATLEYDIKQKQHNPNLNKECLKTIAAFLNTDGGTLLIGVRDDGEVTGIERDLTYVQRKNHDGFELKLRNLIRDRCEPLPLRKLKVSFESLTEGTVCRVDVNPVSLNQVILDKEVYVREGNTTVKLDGRDLVDWIQQRRRA